MRAVIDSASWHGCERAAGGAYLLFEPNKPRLRDQILSSTHLPAPKEFRPAIAAALHWILAGVAGFGGMYAVLWLLEQVWLGPSSP